MIKTTLTTLLMVVLMSFQATTYRVSWYGGKHDGRKTASGEVFNKNEYTCAALNTYKFGQKLEVTNISNNKSVIVRVNDRGQFGKFGRELDLSEAAFKKIASVSQGVIKVSIKKL